MEAFDEWIKGAESEKANKALLIAQRHSHFIPRYFPAIMVIAVATTALKSIPFVLAESASDTQDLARFLVVFGAGTMLLSTLASSVGQVLESAIGSAGPVSFLKLNKGDERLIRNYAKRKTQIVLRFIFGCALTVVLGIASAKISLLL